MWQGRRVVLGVTGGIAAYKSVLLARALTERGAQVDVVLTRGAREFVGPVTFEAVTRRPVRTSLWERDRALDHVTAGPRRRPGHRRAGHGPPACPRGGRDGRRPPDGDAARPTAPVLVAPP